MAVVGPPPTPSPPLPSPPTALHFSSLPPPPSQYSAVVRHKPTDKERQMRHGEGVRNLPERSDRETIKEEWGHGGGESEEEAERGQTGKMEDSGVGIEEWRERQSDCRSREKM
ncbi:unnamed protein product [Pleuronectes platessa]|uniref:Uncharacterized protein n=1 Tax=Pleuronectes platessa TaxID=8262 RepID=A0A9N7VED5_PLEPL|nr:unnamed protein product [Pleuronectes platessa]